TPAHFPAPAGPPRRSRDMPFTAPASARSTMCGSRTATNPSKSPACAAARNASTTRRCARTSVSGGGSWPWGASARTARELARGDDRAVHDGCDLLEGHPKHIVEDERQSFCGLQLLEDPEQGDAPQDPQHR